MANTIICSMFPFAMDAIGLFGIISRITSTNGVASLIVTSLKLEFDKFNPTPGLNTVDSDNAIEMAIAVVAK